MHTALQLYPYTRTPAFPAQPAAPVPTNPTPACVLLPGRLQSDVSRYNAAGDAVFAALGGAGAPAAGRVTTCDLEGVVNGVCGVGYASCNITQCAGPHFTEPGFAILGGAVAGCVGKAVLV